MLINFLNFIGVLIILAGCNFDVQAKENLILKGDSYANTRIHLKKLGWKPNKKNVVFADGTREMDWGDAKIMKSAGFEEIESCSGIGINYCNFNFKKNNVCLIITTTGEYNKKYNSPKIYKWVFQQCSDKKQR